MSKPVAMNNTNFIALLATLFMQETQSPKRPISFLQPSKTSYCPPRRRERSGWREKARKRTYRELAYRRRRNAHVPA